MSIKSILTYESLWRLLYRKTFWQASLALWPLVGVTIALLFYVYLHVRAWLAPIS